MGGKRGRPVEGPVPVISDPVWAEWSEPILAFLDQPRTWPELEKWRKSQGVSGFRFRNCLAWLEDAGLARSEGSGKDVKWVGRKLDEETDDGDQTR